jgi:hypothetical protein
MSARPPNRPPLLVAPSISAPARDVRVDRIGYAQDVLRLWADPMKQKLKERMRRDEVALVEAERYVGQLAESTSSTVDAKKFFKLFKAGKISEADFLNCLRISKEAAGEFMAPRELEAICESHPTEPRLTIARRKGIDLPLATVIDALAEAVRAGGVPDDTAA